MADLNPFDLLGDDDNDDPSKLIAIQQQKVADPAKKSSAPAPAKKIPAKLPTKPPPPAEAVKETKTEVGRGGGRGGGRGYSRGRGGGGFNRDAFNHENISRSRDFSGGMAAPEDAGGKPSERRGGYGGPRPFRGGHRGGFSNGESFEGDRPRRTYERRSGTGRGNEIKRDGAGRGNWGTQADEVTEMTNEVANEGVKNLTVEKPLAEEDAGDEKKENPTAEAEEKEPENKEMTLEEYEKVLEEKRKALQTLKTEERKVDTKAFESMQQISKKSSDDDIFVKLAPKDKKREAAEKEEKAKKAVSINEFLKPPEGERFYAPGGRGRGRGRGRGFRGDGGANMTSNVEAPRIEDEVHFPTLGGK